MTHVQNRMAMKLIAGAPTRKGASGYEPKWSTAFWFGHGKSAGLAETRPTANGYEGHLLSLVGCEAVRSEAVFGSMAEVEAALLAAVAGREVVQEKPAARQERKRP